MADDADPAPPISREPLGAQLARLRKNALLTGVELGRQLRMSQAKISKIETGSILPSVADVRRIAEELHARPEQVEQLVGLAQQLLETTTEPGHRDISTWQQVVANLESRTKVFRSFSPAIISGLLQTSEYARAVFTSLPQARGEPIDHGRVSTAVAARMSRQSVLGDQTRQFRFVLPETLLETMLVDDVAMSGQLNRLSTVAQQKNVDLRIIPNGTRLPFPPNNGFSLLDDHHVIVDLLNTVIITQENVDIELYHEVFGAYETVATSDVKPIFDRHLRRYLDRALGTDS